MTFDAVDCDGTLDILAYARGGSTIVAYELIEIPFQAGATVDVPVSLSETSRRTVDLHIVGLEGATHASLQADWRALPSMLPHESGNYLDLEPPQNSVLWSTSFIDPGPGYGQPVFLGSADFPAKGGCESRAGFAYAGWETPVEHSLGRLAPARAAGARSWALAPGGELGDAIWQSWTFDKVSDGFADSLWLTLEDPARPPQELFLPELPAVLPAGVIRPTTAPTLYSIGHEDFPGVSGYADLVGSGASSFEQEFRVEAYDCGQ